MQQTYQRGSALRWMNLQRWFLRGFYAANSLRAEAQHAANKHANKNNTGQNMKAKSKLN